MIEMVEMCNKHSLRATQTFHNNQGYRDGAMLIFPIHDNKLKVRYWWKSLDTDTFYIRSSKTLRSLYSLILQNFKVHSPIFLGQQLIIHPETWKKIVFLKQCRHLQRLSFKKHRILLIYFIIKRSKTFSSGALPLTVGPLAAP